MKIIRKLLVLPLVLAIVLGIFPTDMTSLQVNAAEQASAVNNLTVKSKEADLSTMDSWTAEFPVTGKLSTEKAGGVWTDKSVLTTGTGLPGNSSVGENNFLVTLSAIGSNMSVTGVATTPTDTMLILDMSSSMYPGYGTTTVTAMIEAVNTTIERLLDLNDDNRVGVTIYFGGGQTHVQAKSGHYKVMLKLGRYEKGTNTAYPYLQPNISDSKLTGISVSSGVTKTMDEKNTILTSNNAVSGSYSVPQIAGTYAQLGILSAKEQFMKATVKTEDGIERKPVFVFLSDGEPTAATENFSMKVTDGYGYVDATMGNNVVGGRQPAQTDFVTQLTAAWAKSQVDEHYTKETPLYYTLSLGNSISLDVMNPSDPTPSSTDENKDTKIQNTNVIAGYWTSLVNNGSVEFTTRYPTSNGGAINQSQKHKVIKEGGFPSDVNQRLYVDKHFTAANAGELANAFNQIVTNVTRESKTYPTLVSGDVNESGYVSFVDKIGEYMEVKEIKGLYFDENKDGSITTIKTGASFAEALTNNTFSKPDGTFTTAGDEFVRSIKDRLGITETAVAQELIANAYACGQLRYTSANDFSNYIGWYAKFENNQYVYLGHYNEKLTNATAPNSATHIVKSYLFLGTVPGAVDTERTDMMYTTVRVIEKMDTGSQEVAFAVPASLLPIVSYEVNLDQYGNPTSVQLGDTSAKQPIRLLYEVGLDSEINQFNISEKVTSEYITENSNLDGSVNFYTNEWARKATDGSEIELVEDLLNTDTTYAYFRPSYENDRYYYTEDSLIYVYTSSGSPEGANQYGEVLVEGANPPFVVYAGSADPKDSTGITYYRRIVHYEKDGNTCKEVVRFRPISERAEDRAEKNEASGEWYLPDGVIHVNMDGMEFVKDNNTTGTVEWSNGAYVQTNNTTTDNQNHAFIVSSFLGNNGKIALNPTAGIEISKVGDANTETEKEFEFVITTDNTSVSGNYPAQLNGTETNAVAFTNGIATVTLKVGESVRIVGLPANIEFKVKEAEDEDYKLNGAKINNNTDYETPESDGSYEIATVANTIQKIEFTNSKITTGNLIIAKIVNHNLGEDYVIPSDKVFTISLVLSEGNVKGKEFDAIKTQVDNSTGGVTTDDNIKIVVDNEGKVTIKDVGGIVLKHNESLEILDLPEGTTATVTEDLVAGFTPHYWVNRTHSGTTAEDGSTEHVSAGVVEIVAKETASVTVQNVYDSEEVYPVNINVSGEKTLIGRDNNTWLDTDSFTIVLEKWNGKTWEKKDEVIVSRDTKNFDFDDFFGEGENHEKYTEVGTYYYRIREEIPTESDKIIPGVTYDTNIYYFRVKVTDSDMDGQLEIDSVENLGQDEDSNEIWTKVTPTTDNEGTDSWNIADRNFENEYKTNSTSTVILIEKSIDNPSGSSHTTMAGFKFILKPEGAEPTRELEENETFEDLNQGGEVTSNDAGEAQFELVYEEAGTYKYTLMEKIPDELAKYSVKNGTSDSYDIIVEVIDDSEGNLQAQVYKASVSEEEIWTKETLVPNGAFSFENTYQPTVASLEVDFVNKILTGRTLEKDEFAFEIRPVHDSKLLVVANDTLSEKTEITAYNGEPDDDGLSNVHFPKMYFNTVGDHFYEIKETSTDGNGVTVDKNIYQLVVSVKDNNGELEAVYTIDDTSGNTVTFNNSYKTEATELDISGKKTYIGRDLRHGVFTFELYEGELVDDEIKVKDSTPIQTATNNADGSFTFNLGKRTAPTGSSPEYYVIKEVIPAGVDSDNKLNGVNYDDSVYTMKVEIVDNDKGSLVPKYTVYKDGNVQNDTPAIQFENSYTTDPVPVVIEGTKTLYGKELEDQEFAFALYGAKLENNELTWIGDSIQIVKNTKDGKFVFDGGINKLTFTSPTTVYYAVKEVIPDGVDSTNTLGDVTYDDTVHYVKVAVTDNGQGKLVATTTILDQYGNLSTGLNFLNGAGYTDDATVELPGKKVIVGREIKEGEKFTFNLYPTNSTFEVAEGAEKSASAQSDEDGRFILQWTYSNATDEGNYYYVLKEEGAGQTKDGLNYSNETYRITVTVLKDKEGHITTKLNVVNDENVGAINGIVFTNDYVPTPITYSIGGTKVLTGKKLEENQFTFNLYRVTEENERELIDTVSNKKPGFFNNLLSDDKKAEFVFENSITFEKAGEYQFVVTEVNGGKKIDHITYDGSEYHVTVTVSDDGLGKLFVESTEITKNGSEVSDIIFNNKYSKPKNPEEPQDLKDPEEPSDTPSSQTVNPPTGDSANPILWIGILAVAVAGVIIVRIIYSKKNKKE